MSSNITKVGLKTSHFVKIEDLFRVKCQKKKDRNHCEEEIQKASKLTIVIRCPS